MTFPTLKDVLVEREKTYICDLLVITKGRVAAAAKLAGTHRVQLWRLIAWHKIQPKDFQPVISRADKAARKRYEVQEAMAA